MRVLQTLALPLGHGTIWNKERKAFLIFFGAGDEARTRYLHLGKVALYQMSYTRILVPPVGIEPTTRGFSVRCSTYWATEACWAEETLLKTRRCVFIWRPWTDSNRRPPAWQAGVLTDCTTGPDYGGNNRARTCDPMLVRHVLSQLSYAPKLFRFGCSPQRRDLLYTRTATLSSTFFDFFLLIFQFTKQLISI